MARQTKAANKLKFETGDVPVQGDYADLIDSYQDELAEGPFADGDKTKLDGIAAGATANSADATLLARANHTGTQTAATISDFATAVGADAAVSANTAKLTADATNVEAAGALMAVDGVGVFDAGADNSAARPTGYAIVYWINVTAEPTNAAAGDLWFEAA